MLSAAAELRTDDLVLGRYRPIQPLGSGGSGSVWLARDESCGDAVALKIIPREGKAAERAEREAEAAARLDHERCLRSRSFGSDADHVYIAYEYVPGETFRQALRGGRLDDASTVEAAAQILDGLAHAHERGIVHRDVKPSNVLIAEGEGTAVRLLDFGLALFDEADTLTAAGDVPGTLAYISPERLKGRTAGPAADVWAVGVLLWEALAGWHPFWTSSMLDTARRIQDPAPSLGEARPDLPAPLIAIVDRALCRDPARRPSAKRMSAAVRSAWRSRSRERRRRRSEPRGRSTRTVAPGRIVAAGLAAVTTGWVVAELPFFPTGWGWLIAALAASLTLWRERTGLALVLAVPILPLGNVALGLALAYSVVALGWLALAWRDPRRGLLFAAGPLLAPVGGLGLLPLVLMGVTNAVRRTALGALGVVAAVAVAAVDGRALPLTGEAAAGALPLDQTESATAAAQAVGSALTAHPELLAVAGTLGLAAATLPHAARRGPWPLAAWGALLLGATLIPLASVAALPLVATTWLTCGALGGRAWLVEQRLQPGQLLEGLRLRLAGGPVPAAARARD